MRPKTPTADDRRLVRSRRAKSGAGFLGIVALACLAVHAGVIALLSMHRAPVGAQTENQGMVELMMVEQKGTEAKQASQPAPETPSQTRPSAKQVPTPPAPPVPDQADAEPAPAPPQRPATEAKADQPAAKAQEAPPPTEPAAAKNLTFDLEGTDSDTNAMVLSGRILPASPDDRYRNRLPAYPLEAALHNEYGDVQVVIHVAANGLAVGADVVSSSGWSSLDAAAVTAVKKWRFHPALKDGQPIPFDMPFIFNFRSN